MRSDGGNVTRQTTLHICIFLAMFKITTTGNQYGYWFWLYAYTSVCHFRWRWPFSGAAKMNFVANESETIKMTLCKRALLGHHHFIIINIGTQLHWNVSCSGIFQKRQTELWFCFNKVTIFFRCWNGTCLHSLARRRYRFEYNFRQIPVSVNRDVLIGFVR